MGVWNSGLGRAPALLVFGARSSLRRLYAGRAMSQVFFWVGFVANRRGRRRRWVWCKMAGQPIVAE